jgi:hypothetical protein
MHEQNDGAFRKAERENGKYLRREERPSRGFPFALGGDGIELRYAVT